MYQNLLVNGPFSRLVRIFRLRINKHNIHTFGIRAASTQDVLRPFRINLHTKTGMRFATESAIFGAYLDVSFHKYLCPLRRVITLDTIHLKTNQHVTVTANPVSPDGQAGFLVPSNIPTWNSNDTTIATLVQAADGMSAVVTAVGKTEGMAHLRTLLASKLLAGECVNDFHKFFDGR
jgi:hypothetical protein